MADEDRDRVVTAAAAAAVAYGVADAVLYRPGGDPGQVLPSQGS